MIADIFQASLATTYSVTISQDLLGVHLKLKGINSISASW